MKAVIVYEDLVSAEKAGALLERATHRADESLHWIIKMWRFDLLNDPIAATTALSDAMDGHLILICLPNIQELAPSLHPWLEKWATMRRVQEAGLGLWKNSKPLPRRLLRQMCLFAKRHGLALLHGGADLAKAKKAKSALHFPSRNRIISQMHISPPIGHPRHGINE
jgi:hypothetical protein